MYFLILISMSPVVVQRLQNNGPFCWVANHGSEQRWAFMTTVGILPYFWFCSKWVWLIVASTRMIQLDAASFPSFLWRMLFLLQHIQFILTCAGHWVMPDFILLSLVYAMVKIRAKCAFVKMWFMLLTAKEEWKRMHLLEPVHSASVSRKLWCVPSWLW